MEFTIFVNKSAANSVYTFDHNYLTCLKIPYILA